MEVCWKKVLPSLVLLIPTQTIDLPLSSCAILPPLKFLAKALLPLVLGILFHDHHHCLLLITNISAWLIF